MTLKKNLFAALIAVSAVALTADSSYAFFGHWRGGSCGSSGGSWGGGGSWGSRGSWGSHGSWGGSYGSGGSHGGYSYSNSCGSSGGYSASYGYDGGYGGYARTGVVYDRVVSSRPVRTVVAAAPAVKTRLTLRVPAEAKVTLAGVETKQAGEVREFATSRLASGQVWQDYKVIVEMNRDGKTVREERVLKLTGGQDQELAVNFESDSTQQVAQLTR